MATEFSRQCKGPWAIYVCFSYLELHNKLHPKSVDEDSSDLFDVDSAVWIGHGGNSSFLLHGSMPQTIGPTSRTDSLVGLGNWCRVSWG